jgi:hypothetical protein
VQAQERERVEKLAELAQKNTAAAEQVRVLQKQLSTSEGLKQGNFDKLGERTSHIELMTERSERLAVQLAQGGGPEVEQLRAYGEVQREKARQELVGVMEGLLAGKVASGPDFRAKLLEVGYSTGKDAEGKGVLVDDTTGARFRTDELKPHGQAFGPQLTAAVERTSIEAAQAAKREQSKGQSRGGGFGMR